MLLYLEIKTFALQILFWDELVSFSLSRLIALLAVYEVDSSEVIIEYFIFEVQIVLINYWSLLYGFALYFIYFWPPITLEA